MAIKEIGQSAGEVELQDDPGLIKNAEGETVIAVTNDQRVGIGTTTPGATLGIDGDLKFEPTAISTAHVTCAGSIKIDCDNNLEIAGGDADSVRIGRTNTALAKIHLRSGADTDLVVSGGKVGVGTSEPGAALEVVGDVISSGDLTLGDGKAIKSASGGAAITIDAGANVTVSNNLTLPAAVSLPNTGDGTIGTSDTAADANGKALTLAAGSTAAGGTNNTGTGGDLTLKPGAGKGTAAGGDLKIQTAPAGGSGTTVNNYVTKMVVTGAGNVGMGGNTAPARALDVLAASSPQLRLSQDQSGGSEAHADLQVAADGNLTLTTTSGGSATGTLKMGGDAITVGAGSAGDTKVIFDGNAQDYRIGLYDTDDTLEIGVGAAHGTTPAIVVNSSANVTVNNNLGIGATSPASPNGNAKVVELEGTSVGVVLNSTNGGGHNFEIQHNGGDLKIQKETTTIAHWDSDGGLAYKPAVIEHASGTLTSLTAAKSATTVLLTADSSTVVQLPELTDSDKGAQFVISNVHTATISGAVTVAGSDKFYDADNTSGYTTAQDLTTMQTKTFICFGADKWLIVG